MASRVVFALAASLLAVFTVAAGPPFRTDDPEPTEYHCWETYCATQISHDIYGTSGEAPFCEANYGVVNSVQMELHIPLAFNRPHAGNSAYGPGDAEFGLKCRLATETTVLPLVSIYPSIEVPTGDPAKHLGAGNTQLFVPLWLQKSWGAWTTYGGGGYLINFGPNQAGSLFFGWEGQRDISEALTIGAEIFSTIVPSESSENEWAFNIGATVNFSESNHFLVSAGRDIAGPNDFFLYTAYGLTIGPKSSTKN